MRKTMQVIRNFILFFFFLTSSLKKYVFYNYLINNVLYLRVT